MYVYDNVTVNKMSLIDLNRSSSDEETEGDADWIDDCEMEFLSIENILKIFNRL